ncbi:MAG: transposase [Bacteroidales bacterium]|nr:transposase [Bacteroidales bacterium]
MLLLTGIETNMKNHLVNLTNKILLCKHTIIKTINDMLKNICQVEHSQHRSLHNFIMNFIAVLGAYCFF